MRNDQLPAVPKFGGGWSTCTMQPNYETKGMVLKKVDKVQGL